MRRMAIGSTPEPILDIIIVHKEISDSKPRTAPPPSTAAAAARAGSPEGSPRGNQISPFLISACRLCQGSLPPWLCIRCQWRDEFGMRAVMKWRHYRPAAPTDPPAAHPRPARGPPVALGATEKALAGLPLSSRVQERGARLKPWQPGCPISMPSITRRACIAHRSRRRKLSTPFPVPGSGAQGVTGNDCLLQKHDSLERHWLDWPVRGKRGWGGPEAQ